MLICNEIIRFYRQKQLKLEHRTESVLPGNAKQNLAPHRYLNRQKNIPYINYNNKN